MGSLKPENFGQMNMYLNYYEEEINDEGDNKTIGIILCTDKDNIVAEYSMEGMNNIKIPDVSGIFVTAVAKLEKSF